MENTHCNSSAISTATRAGNPSDDSGGSEDIEESQDEEPSSSDNPQNVETELENFRLQWKREIELSPAKENSSPTVQKDRAVSMHQTAEKVEEKARCLFLCGVQAEKSGKLEDAISFYRRAVQLVPDIEFRIDDYANECSDDLFSDESEDNSTLDENSSEDDEEVDNLVSKFQKWTAKVGTMCICQPKHQQQASHISSLPPEIFLYILKWVVSQDLDVLSLEQVAKVCRGFYSCARDPEIWRLVCLRIWEVNIDSPNKYGSWRNMFIQRPHLFYNGAYISKTTYVRYGESSFQDTNYRPCYLVEYYRYLRFFPEGLVLMLTTSDDPYQSLFKLRHRRSRYQNIMYGRYKLVGNTVIAIVKKPKGETITPGGLNYYRYRKQRQANLQEACEQTFHLELEMKNLKNRNNYQLTWNSYSIHMVYRNGHETVSDFDLTPSNFPPFWFSRVKSFTAESESPLK